MTENSTVILPYDSYGDTYIWDATAGHQLKPHIREILDEIAPSGWDWWVDLPGIRFTFKNPDEAMRFKLTF